MFSTTSKILRYHTIFHQHIISYIQYNECNALFQYIQHNYMTCPLHIVKNSTLNTPLSALTIFVLQTDSNMIIKLHNTWRFFKPDMHSNNACTSIHYNTRCKYWHRKININSNLIGFCLKLRKKKYIYIYIYISL